MATIKEEQIHATPTPDDVAVARRIQRLLGDHRHPVGRAGPWSSLGRLTGTPPASSGAGRPVRHNPLRA